MAEDDWDRPDLSEIWSKGGMLFDAAFDDSAAYIPLLDVQTTSAAFTSGQLIAPTSDPSSLFPASYVDTPAPTISTPSAFDSPSPSSDDVGLAKSRKRKRDLVNLTEPPRVLGSYGATSGVGTMMVFGPAQPRRSRYDEETRAEVARTRDHGACPRCRKHKSKCRRELYELCPRCRAVKNPLTLHMPCFLATLFEAQLFRDRPSVGHPLYVWRPGVYELQSAVESPQATLQVRLMQGLGETLTVDVALYRPQPGDKTTYTATFAFAEPITVELPPYCLADLDQAKQNMLAYVELSRNAYIDDLMGPDQLTSTVLTEARDFAALNPASTARKALNLLAADRIIERDWTMCEGDATGIPSLPSFDSPGGVRRPVTPIMDGQLDQLVIQGFLQPLRDELLEQMQTSINTDRRREHWYDIFLTTFVLLANAEQLLAHSRRNAIRHGAQGRYNSPELASLYFHACKIFIAHFHFVSNFKMLAAINLFSSEVHSMAKLDKNQIEFLRRLQEIVRTNRPQLQQLRQDFAFEHPSYWTHQIMYQNWAPSDAVTERSHIYHAPAVF